jgi:hypothetical protein
MTDETNIIGFMLISFDHSISEVKTRIYDDLESVRKVMRAEYNEACGRDEDEDEDFTEDDKEDVWGEDVHYIDDWSARVYFDTGDGDYSEHKWEIVILKFDGNKIKQFSPTEL